jgi:biopolymer transport protein ExbB/TolQ
MGGYHRERIRAVTVDRDRDSMLTMLGSLGWPLMLGLAASGLFYGAIYQGMIGSDFVHRYFASHPVSLVATGMFFVGLAALLLKLLNLFGQFAAMRLIRLESSESEPLPITDSSPMLDQLAQLPAAAQRSYLGNRLREALEHIERTGQADTLDEELKYLADLDVARQQDSYALVRIIIWATPMLGFLGTVIGITRALGDLDPKMLATSIQTAMEGLVAGLYIAFDTTALALCLSIGLMFFQFFVDRLETQLLASVDVRAGDELTGRFQTQGTNRDPQVMVVQRMAQEMVLASEQLVTRQTELWRSAMEAADQKWGQLVGESSTRVQADLGAALQQSLERFADRWAESEQAAAERVRNRWEQWQTALSDNARMLQAQQQEMTRQGEVMERVIEVTGEVTRLEAALNENLRSLAGAKNFEDTVMSLAAAIHLLNSRLGAVAEPSRPVDLGTSESQGRAA